MFEYGEYDIICKGRDIVRVNIDSKEVEFEVPETKDDKTLSLNDHIELLENKVDELSDKMSMLLNALKENDKNGTK